jgi:mono/diheme cytochrome c family protein
MVSVVASKDTLVAGLYRGIRCSGRPFFKFSIILLASLFYSVGTIAAEGVDPNAPLVHLAQASTKNGDAIELYLKNCGACHQPNGEGLPGAFPPLANSDYIAGDKSTLMESTVNGLSGPITVNGKEYNNVMPAMSYLSDEELASILTYVVHSWGNPGGRFKASIIGVFRVNMGLDSKK